MRIAETENHRGVRARGQDYAALLDALLAHLKQTAALSQAAGLLTWDQEAMMPPKGAPQRAEQAGALAAVSRHPDPDHELEGFG